MWAIFSFIQGCALWALQLCDKGRKQTVSQPIGQPSPSVGSTDNPNPAKRPTVEWREEERLGAERLEAERLEAERVEAKRREAERLEAERLEAERLEAERLEAERVEAKRREAEVSSLQIGERLRCLIMDRRKGLQKMYGETEAELDKSLRAPIEKGVEMARKLVSEMGCSVEIAKDLTVLTLYDVAILIDDSGSMISEENGARKRTLVQFIDYITEICSMANESGIFALRFMNRGGGKKNWTGRSQEYLDRQTYGKAARIGTALKKKILDKFVIRNSNQSKPLLVLIVTAGVVEGERKGHLENVIRDCLSEREAAGKGRDAVTFQFSRIGNDPGAAQLLIDLDKDPDLGKYIDILPIEFDIERQLMDKWWVLPKILIGAILPDWDMQDNHRYTEEQDNFVGEKDPGYDDSGSDWDD